MNLPPQGRIPVGRHDPKNSYATMDALRALVAIAVAISHIRNIIMQDYGGQGGPAKVFYFATGFGHAGVVMFFVLSGFWITKTVVRRASDRKFWYEYMVDRLSRLWVVVIPALVLGGILDICGSQILHASLYNGTSGAESMEGAINLSFPTFIANILFLQNMFAPVFGSNGPLWSLAFEFWYYIWFPAIWFAIRYKRPTLQLVTLILGLIFPGLAVGFLSWLCGAALFGAVKRWSRTMDRRPIIDVSMLVGGSLFLLSALIFVRLYPYPWMDPVLAVAFATFLLVVCVVDWAVLGTGVLRKFGAKASFSLYAIHYPIAALAAAIVAPSGRLPYSIGTACLIVVVLALTVAVAAVFAACTEAHTGRIRQKLGAPRHLVK